MSRPLRIALIALAATLATATALAGWLLLSPAGSAWLLARLPGVQVEAPEGSLLGDFRARRLLLRWAGGTADLRGLRWAGLGLREGRLAARELVVDELTLRTQPSGDPLAAPADLSLPLGLRLPRLAIGRLSWAPDQPPLLGLNADLDLPRHGTHHLRLNSASWQQVQFTGQLQLASAQPLQTQLQLTARQREGSALPWQAEARAQGPLAQLAVQAEVLAAGQTLSANGQLQPFAPWPVSALQLQARQFDLAALATLAPGLPRTALTGQARLHAPARNTEATLQADLSNAAPGRWDQGALPVRRLQLALAGRPDQLTTLRLTTLDAELAGGARVHGHGRREADGRWQLEARVQALRPELLDARAAPARLDGPLALSGGGTAPLQARLDVAGTLAQRPLRLQAHVQGRLRGGSSRWDVEALRLASDASLLSVNGSLTLPQAGLPGTRLQAQLRQFDPRLLWRGAPDSAWARLPGSTQLNADLTLDLSGHRADNATGRAELTLLPSQLAGLVLDGRLQLTRARTTEAAAFDLNTRLGSNRLQADGQAQPQAVTARLQLSAAKLAELSPLLALAGQGPITGQAESDGELQLQRVLMSPVPTQAGKAASRGTSAQAPAVWQVGGSGRATLKRLSAQGLALDNAQARWTLPAPGTAGDAPVSLQLEAAGLRHPQARLRTVTLDLQGRRSSHTLKLQLAGQLPRDEQDIPLDATLQAQGGWNGQAWAGRLARLDIAPLRPGLPATLAAADIGLRAALTDSGWDLSAEPGRAELGGAFVRWQRLGWRGGERPEARAELQLEDLAAAPLLARWQPDFGWGGDLRITGHASLLLTDTLTADVLLQRQGGDLRVTDEFGTRALGLSDLRLALNVRDGVWMLAQGLAGQELGGLGGALTLRPTGRWPDADTPVQGVLQANVSDMATWGRWVPPGWRVAGRAAATVQIDGRLGAPTLHGRAEGEGIALRHLLYGVDVTEGRFTLDLRGQHAELTQLQARAGEGWLRASGRAELGAKPTARIELVADKLRVLSRVDRRVVASGNATLALDEQTLQLNGTLRADEGLFDVSRADAPTLADDVVVRRGPRDTHAAPEAEAASPRLRRGSRIALALDFGRDFKVSGRGLTTTLRGQLQLTQKDDSPLRMTGKLAADGGQYAAYGQKLEIERGDISFTGAPDNPALDLLAVRPNLDVRVGVQVGGTAQAPRIGLYSEPEMSDTDKLSWLLLGRAPDGLGRTDTALLQRAAMALLSGEGEGATGRALRQLGLDELSLSQSDDDTRATIVRLGKQISRRWYVGYERSLNATTGSWQLIYRIAQRFTLRAQSGDDTALDLIWQWRWN